MATLMPTLLMSVTLSEVLKSGHLNCLQTIFDHSLHYQTICSHSLIYIYKQCSYSDLFIKLIYKLPKSVIGIKIIIYILQKLLK